MLALPDGFWAIAPDLRGFGGAAPDAAIDATRGMGDLADDAVALLDHLGIERTHLVGNSMGGSVVWRLLAEHSRRVRSAVQVAPGSPYGFGATRDVDGTPCSDDYAGSGAGLIRPALVERIRAGDASCDSPACPRSLLRSVIVKPPLIPEREDALVAAMLTTHLGERAYPGDFSPSPNWPFVAPGVWGINNALSPKYVRAVRPLLDTADKVDLLWIRGSHDLAVADRAAGDPGTWGPTNLVPGYPGEDAYPSQPMLAQTRAVLDQYANAGGSYREVVIDGCGHVPFIEKSESFNQAFHAFLAP